MVNFYTPQPKQTNTAKAFELTAHSLDLLGRGVASVDGITYFCEGLLPTERARVIPTSIKGKVGIAKITKLLIASDKRQKPDCDLLQKCGGCPLAHIDKDLALEGKIAGLQRLFYKNLGVKLDSPDLIVHSKAVGYRRACRLSARADHGRLSLGFREEKSHTLVKVDHCQVLTERINAILSKLCFLLDSLSCKHKLGHVEFLDSDGALGVLLRLTQVLSAQDEQALIAFAQKYKLVLSVSEPFKPKISLKKDEVVIKERLLSGRDEDLFVLSQGIKIFCSTSSFVQINKEVNNSLGAFILDVLKPSPQKRILDLFCGLGNFTLPIAKQGATVYGIDIVRDMIARANANAKAQGFSTAHFIAANLDESFENQTFAQGVFDAAVLDPGRQGAPRAIKFLINKKVPLIVMISCNPQASARDCIELVNNGYKITSWGVMDMFPRTKHIESILVFSQS